MACSAPARPIWPVCMSQSMVSLPPSASGRGPAVRIWCETSEDVTPPAPLSEAERGEEHNSSDCAEPEPTPLAALPEVGRGAEPSYEAGTGRGLSTEPS